VTEWLAKRDELTAKNAARKSAKRVKETPPENLSADDEAKTSRNASSSRRSARRAGREREDRVAAGLQELERWLRDLVRQGLAYAQVQPPRYWENIAARMIDAQAPGVARWLREMSGLPATGEGWAERLLQRIGLLHLLIESYKRIDTLPEAAQADVRAALGFTLKQEEVMATAGISDTWAVLGLRSYEEERLRVQRTWLHGRHTGRPALLVEFAYGNQVLDVSVTPGTQFEAELAFYPGSYPLRAALKQRLSEPASLESLGGYPDHATALAAYTDALALNPWLETFPIGIQCALPVHQGDHWFVQDATAHNLPLASTFTGGWHLVAVSGGRPCTLFGEWDGLGFYPLSAWADERFALFSI
jgi:hypothetical protein